MPDTKNKTNKLGKCPKCGQSIYNIEDCIDHYRCFITDATEDIEDIEEDNELKNNFIIKPEGRKDWWFNGLDKKMMMSVIENLIDIGQSFSVQVLPKNKSTSDTD